MKRSDAIFRFGLFELNARTGELSREGTTMNLQEQPQKLLLLLLERPGKLVTREEIQENLWGTSVHVDFDNSLNAAVSRLREALGDTAANPRFVATVPRRGYRFVAPVERRGEPAPSRNKLLWTMLGSLLLLALALGSYFAGSFRRGAPPSTERKKIAVLPFENLSRDPDQDYLSDGLTEELIARLSTLNPDELGVIARTSVMRYKNAHTPIDQIGRELDVQYILEGTFRKENQTARVTTRLIEVASQTHLWTSSFDQEMADFFALEREVAVRVAEALSVRLLPLSATQQTPNRAAYEHYLRGRHFLNQRSMSGFERARSAFEQALRQDADYADARVGLATTFALMGEYDIWRPAPAFSKAAEAGTKALTLDPSSAEGHLLMAYVHLAYEWDWQSGERELHRALTLNPNLVDGHVLMGGYLSTLGRHDEAIASVLRARELDPLSSVIQADLCWRFFLARRFAEAIAQCRQAIELDPDFLPAHDNLKWSLMLAGRNDEGREVFLKVVELEGHDKETVSRLSRLAVEQGIEGLVRDALASPEERAQGPQESPYDIAIDYAVLGEVASALEWLERAFQERETDIPSIGVDPRLDPLRGEPRFEELLRRLGWPHQ